HVVAFVVGLSTFLASILLTSVFAGAGAEGPGTTKRPARRRRNPRPAAETLAATPTSLERGGESQTSLVVNRGESETSLVVD
ncbi:MAG TPA: hypothetical protein VGQ83_29180, partial [Polyangia bacterium]